jgi:hypothetical protein
VLEEMLPLYSVFSSLILSINVLVEFHSWVNPEAMLDKCLIGVLVPEPPDEEESD